MTNKEIREYLDKINSSNVLNAFILLDNDKVRADGLIRKYVIKYNDRSYSPPEVLRLAYNDATGNRLPESFFAKIGEGTEQFKFIRELGFEIIMKELLNISKNMKSRTVVFKKVPKNEVLKGTEIAILKYYMDEGIIQDPKTSAKHIVTSNNARY